MAIQLPPDIPQPHSVTFSPAKGQYGFDARDFDEAEGSFRNLGLAGASNILHNFYGIDFIFGFGGDSSDIGFDVSAVTYRDFKLPSSRQAGSYPNRTSVFTTSSGLNSCTVTLDSPSKMEKRGDAFGIKLAEMSATSQRSRYYGGFLFRKQIITSFFMQDREVLDFAPTGLSVWDNSYQKYLSSQTWEHPDLIPEITKQFTSSSITLRSSNGYTSSFNFYDAQIQRIDKRPLYDDKDDGTRVVREVQPQIPDPILAFGFEGNGLFFKYQGDTSYLQPKNYNV